MTHNNTVQYHPIYEATLIQINIAHFDGQAINEFVVCHSVLELSALFICK